MRRFLIVLGLAPLTACIEAQPLVSDFNGDSVKVQVSAFAPQDEARAKSLAEAQRICGRVGKQAEYASSRAVADGYTTEHIFLCL